MVRVTFQRKCAGAEDKRDQTVMPPVAQTLKADFPEVEAATRIRDFRLSKTNL